MIIDLFGELFSLGLGQNIQSVDYCNDVLFVMDGGTVGEVYLLQNFLVQVF